MSAQVFKLESDEWLQVVGQYLASKYPQVPASADVKVKVTVNSRTKVMTVEIES